MRMLLLLLVLLGGCTWKPEASRFRAPDGFVVEEAAGVERTGALTVLTFDSVGRPTVATERLGPVIMEDRNSDGKFETETVFTRAVRNVRGMWWDGRTLYAAGQHSGGEDSGLFRCPDMNGDDIADSCELLTRFEGSMGEQGPHAIRRGIDGEAMVMLASQTGLPAERIDKNSPLVISSGGRLLTPSVDEREAAAGGILTRLNRKTGQYLVLGGGFRKAYDFAVNPEGDAFTSDSETERDMNLALYRGARSIQVAPGGDYGWRPGPGALAGYNMDTLPGMRDLGRGSPAGVEFYTSTTYPAAYRGAYFEADGGRVLVSKPEKCGGAWCVGPKATVFVHGEAMKANDIEVGPDGALWIAGDGLYRVVYRPGLAQQVYAGSTNMEGMLAVVRQAQPLSSWGHAALLAAKARMGDAEWKKQLWAMALNRGQEAEDRVSALLILDRTGPRATAELLRPLAQDPRSAVRAAAVLVASFHGSPRAKAIVTGGLSDVDPFVRRRALEGMVRMGLNAETHESFAPVNIVYEGLNDRDRAVRYAARIALERYPQELWAGLALEEKSATAGPEAFYALTRTAKSAADLDALFPLELALLKRESLTAEQRLNALRAWQLTAMRREGGAPDAVRATAHAVLAPQFPASDERLTRELARALAYCGRTEAIEKLLAAMPAGDENKPLQAHLAYCLREIKTGWTGEQQRRMKNRNAEAAER